MLKDKFKGLKENMEHFMNFQGVREEKISKGQDGCRRT
jgi:hypothetical protein